MKRIRLLVLLSMVTLALPLGLLQGVAKATGDSYTTTNSVYIQQYADYDFMGTQLDVGLYVTCKGGSGTVVVNVEQYPPQTPYPVAHGSGPQLVVCDGRTHSVGVTIDGFGFDAGSALAKAQLITPTGTVKTKRWIQIVVV
jgi:hypothetical protein